MVANVGNHAVLTECFHAKSRLQKLNPGRVWYHLTEIPSLSFKAIDKLRQQLSCDNYVNDLLSWGRRCLFFLSFQRSVYESAVWFSIIPSFSSLNDHEHLERKIAQSDKKFLPESSWTVLIHPIKFKPCFQKKIFYNCGIVFRTGSQSIWSVRTHKLHNYVCSVMRRIQSQDMKGHFLQNANRVYYPIQTKISVTLFDFFLITLCPKLFNN